MKRLINLFKNYIAVGLLILLWIAFAKPYFIDNLVPFPSRQLVSFFSPWNAYDEYAGPVKNNAMPDVVTQIYPWKYFAIQELKEGRLPVWNPYNFSGYPQLANFQTAVFSPFTLFYFILPFIDAWSITILLQPLLAGLLTYLFLRVIQVSKWGALIGSISFMFCGFNVVWMAYGSLSMAIAFLPLALYSIEKYWMERNIKYILLLSLSVAISLLSGHFQTSLYLLVFTSLYVLFKVVTTKDIQSGLVSGLGLGVGILISSVQLLPTLALFKETIRSSSSIVDDGIPFYYLSTIVAPDFFGNPVTRNDWIGFYAERASFIGIVPLTLSFFALLKGKNKYTIFFLLMGVGSLLLALDSPLQTLLARSGIPVLSSSNPTRIIVLWSFAFSVLAALGLDKVLNLKEKLSLRRIIPIVAGVGIFLLALWLSLYLFNLLPTDKVAIAQRNLILPTGIFFVMCLSFMAYVFLSPSKNKILLLVILISLTMVDSYRFATKWMPFDSRSLLFPEVKVIQAMQQLQGEGRFFGSFGTEVQTYFGVRSIEGYDPLYLRRYGEFIKAATTGKYTIPDRSWVSLDRQSPHAERVLNFLSVTHIYHPKSHNFQNWAFPVWAHPDRYKVVYEDDRFQVYQNTDALPRARLYYEYETIPDSKKLLSRFYEENFSYENVLLLEEKPSIEIRNTDIEGKASIRLLQSDRVEIEVDSPAQGLLLLADPYYPQWKATVNGNPVKILRADYAFRAVEIPKGKSKVVFNYSYF